MFFQMGLVAARTATRIVYLDAILYLGAGIVGTGHHWYFTGQGTLNMGLAACFSAMEVVPLTLLTLDAWDFVSLQDRRCAECGHAFAARQTWAIYFLMAVGFWNFVGAGIFGFLINLPIVSYFEVGTLLTSNHGHTAMFGVFGMLALAVVVFCLRAFADDGRWQRVEGLIRTGFWGLNVGLGLMVLLDQQLRHRGRGDRCERAQAARRGGHRRLAVDLDAHVAHRRREHRGRFALGFATAADEAKRGRTGHVRA